MGTPAGRQLARTATRRPENKIWSKALFAQVVCTPSEPKLSLLPAVLAQRKVYLTRRVVARLGPTAGRKVCVSKGGSRTHECRTRLEECLTREGQARARANAQAPGEALVPDTDVLEESAGPRVVAEDAQAAAQAQAHACQVPQLGKKSSAQALVNRDASKREVESKELGDMGGFDMDVEGDNTPVSVSKKIKIASLTVAGRHVNMLVQTSMAMLVTAPHPRKEVYGHLRGAGPFARTCTKVARKSVRTCANVECMSGCRAPSSGEASRSSVVG